MPIAGSPSSGSWPAERGEHPDRAGLRPERHVAGFCGRVRAEDAEKKAEPDDRRSDSAPHKEKTYENLHHLEQPSASFVTRGVHAVCRILRAQGTGALTVLRSTLTPPSAPRAVLQPRTTQGPERHSRPEDRPGQVALQRWCVRGPPDARPMPDADRMADELRAAIVLFAGLPPRRRRAVAGELLSGCQRAERRSDVARVSRALTDDVYCRAIGLSLKPSEVEHGNVDR